MYLRYLHELSRLSSFEHEQGLVAVDDDVRGVGGEVVEDVHGYRRGAADSGCAVRFRRRKVSMWFPKSEAAKVQRSW